MENLELCLYLDAWSASSPAMPHLEKERSSQDPAADWRLRHLVRQCSLLMLWARISSAWTVENRAGQSPRRVSVSAICQFVALPSTAELTTGTRMDRLSIGMMIQGTSLHGRDAERSGVCITRRCLDLSVLHRTSETTCSKWLMVQCMHKRNIDRCNPS